jgi:hypothetical protein
MTLRATPDKSGHCPRCRQDVRTVRPWPHWRKLRYGYFAGLGVALCGAPVILADAFILIPCLIVYIVAIGPLNSLVAKLPTCAQCGAPADPLRSLRLMAQERELQAAGLAAPVPSAPAGSALLAESAPPATTAVAGPDEPRS